VLTLVEEVVVLEVVLGLVGVIGIWGIGPREAVEVILYATFVVCTVVIVVEVLLCTG